MIHRRVQSCIRSPRIEAGVRDDHGPGAPGRERISAPAAAPAARAGTTRSHRGGSARPCGADKISAMPAHGTPHNRSRACPTTRQRVRVFVSRGSATFIPTITQAQTPATMASLLPSESAKNSARRNRTSSSVATNIAASATPATAQVENGGGLIRCVTETVWLTYRRSPAGARAMGPKVPRAKAIVGSNAC